MEDEDEYPNYRNYDLFHSMMKTDQLSSKDMYNMVREAYGAYYLSGDWLKMLAKRYCNPFGKFNWMGYRMPRFIKHVIRSGYRMLHTQAISNSVVSDELREVIRLGKIKNKIQELKQAKQEEKEQEQTEYDKSFDLTPSEKAIPVFGK